MVVIQLHQPKTETFDTATGTNTDPKGIVREVDDYHEHPWGLYMARPTPGRRQFHYIESWLLPAWGIRATDFWFNPGYERNQDLYLDIVSVDRDHTTWRTTDLYVDIVLRTGQGLDILDTEELLEALTAGLLTTAQATDALRTAYDTIDGLARHHYNLMSWLAASDVRLSWQRHS